jgi:hypothetical protein
VGGRKQRKKRALINCLPLAPEHIPSSTSTPSSRKGVPHILTPKQCGEMDSSPASTQEGWVEQSCRCEFCSMTHEEFVGPI